MNRRGAGRSAAYAGSAFLQPPRHTPLGVRLLRSTAPLIVTPLSFSALCVRRAGVKHRSLAPDDPFGEQSSWEDPSDGVYAAWRDVDQEGFVTAAESSEVRNAHFGPEWSRFTTVGRLSVKKMQEDSRHRSRVEGEPSAYPTAEELHDKELQERKRLLAHNYASYEEYLANELGGGTDYDDFGSGSFGADAFGDADQQGIRRHRLTREGVEEEAGPGERCSLEDAAAMERAFSEVEGLDGHDRMARRNPAREALAAAEAATDFEDSVDLPDFIREGERAEEDSSSFDRQEAGGDDNTGATAHATSSTAALRTTAASSAQQPLNSEAETGTRRPQLAKEIHRQRSYTDGVAGERSKTPGANDEAPPRMSPQPPTTAAVAATEESPPEAFVAAVLNCLPGRHQNTGLPLADPIHWQTADVLCFLKRFESCPDGEASALDESMLDAFHLAKVDGELLLNVVTPPRLFRVMRRWHVRRLEIIAEAWAHRRVQLAKDATNHEEHAAEEALRAVAQAAERKLDDAVTPVTPLLVQETILLCFPYAR